MKNNFLENPKNPTVHAKGTAAFSHVQTWWGIRRREKVKGKFLTQKIMISFSVKLHAMHVDTEKERKRANITFRFKQ